MECRTLVFYGSYRSDRKGIRLADFIVRRLAARGDDVELIDAKAVGLPMLDRMFKEYSPGTAPQAMVDLAAKIRAADAFLFVVGEYNWGCSPVSRTSLITSSRSGSGDPRRLRAIRPEDYPVRDRVTAGTTRCRRWEWS